jgi:hypothetical protein
MEISNIDGRKAIKSTNEFFKKKKKGVTQNSSHRTHPEEAFSACIRLLESDQKEHGWPFLYSFS